jgi:CheY-like chemotaxis protein/PAS domain-containing protein
MQQGRPRLLILGGPHVAAEEAAARLGDRFDTVVLNAGEALAALKGQRFEAVLADVGDYLALERQLVGQQSSALLNALGEGVCLADAQGHVVWSNERFRAYDEPLRQRIAGQCRVALRWITDQPDAAAAARRYDVDAPDGSRSFEVMISPVYDMAESGQRAGGGPPRHVAAVVWDVTTRRRRQEKQALIDAAGAELVRLDAEAIRKMSTPERLRVLEQKIVKYAHDLLNFDHFAIRLAEEKTGKLELVMSQGLPPVAMEVELYAKRDGNGISGFVAATGRSYICQDAATDERYVVGIEGARSSLTVPLRLHDRVIGIFNVESTRPAAFNEEDRQFAEGFAMHVALALHMLNLLVIERSTTGEAVSGNVEGELNEPLDDILSEATRLKQTHAGDAAFARHIDRIVADVEAIRRRVKDVASGPRNILGAEKALTDAAIDPAMAGKRVLVADDEPRIRQVVRDVLRARGADVVMCEDGASAMAALRGASGAAASGPGAERTMGGGGSGAPVKFDLLISDIKLPDATGYDVFAAARKVNPTLPVILMTGFGYDPSHSIVRASQEGLQCVLLKPFQAERLIEEVHKALAAPR